MPQQRPVQRQDRRFRQPWVVGRLVVGVFHRGEGIELINLDDQRPLDPLTLDIYPNEQGAAEGRLYEDDGRSFAYETGQFCVTLYRCQQDVAQGRWIIEARREGAYTPARRAVLVRLHSSAGLHHHELPADEEQWRIEL